MGPVGDGFLPTEIVQMPLLEDALATGHSFNYHMSLVFLTAGISALEVSICPNKTVCSVLCPASISNPPPVTVGMHNMDLSTHQFGSFTQTVRCIDMVYFLRTSQIHGQSQFSYLLFVIDGKQIDKESSKTSAIATFDDCCFLVKHAPHGKESRFDQYYEALQADGQTTRSTSCTCSHVRQSDLMETR